MTLSCLKDLDLYKDSLITSKININDISKIDNVGGNLVNSYNNKLFYWNFEPQHIKCLVECFEGLSSSKNLSIFSVKIKNIADDIMSKNICPIEAILYASKIINYILDKNDLVIEAMGDIIEYIYLKNKDEYKETIKFILKEWSFKNQIVIVINACGKIKDIELLDLIYKFHTSNDNKLYALKAFMNFNNEDCINYSLSLISQNNELDKIEVDMAKFFINNYKKSFGSYGIKKAEEYLLDESLSKQSKKIISRAIPSVSIVESISLNTMIKEAKNWYNNDNFEEFFRGLMKDSKTRKDAFLAVRYSNHLNVEKIIIDTINEFDCNSIEIGTALITIAQWGSRIGISNNFYELIEKYKKDEDKLIYCNASMCSIGSELDSIELIREYLEQKIYNQRQIFSIIRDCSYKSNKLLRKSIRKVYREYLNSDNPKKIIKAINGSYELCNKAKFNFKI